MVTLLTPAGTKDEDSTVILQPAAYVYLEQHLNKAQ